MDDGGPILVNSAVPEQDIPESTRITNPERTTLSVSIPEDVLSAVSENTAELQDKLNKFVNGLNSKIQSLTSRTNALIQTHQTQSLRTVAEAQHCTESLKLLIEEYEEIETGWEEVRRVREIVNGLKERVNKLEKILN